MTVSQKTKNRNIRGPSGASLVAQLVKNPPAMQETPVWFLGWEDLLKGQATHSVFMGFSGGSDGKESTCKAGHLSSIPGLGWSLGGGHGNLLQYSCLENPHRQRSLAGYYWVAQSRTGLKRRSTPAMSCINFKHWTSYMKLPQRPHLFYCIATFLK